MPKKTTTIRNENRRHAGRVLNVMMNVQSADRCQKKKNIREVKQGQTIMEEHEGGTRRIQVLDFLDPNVRVDILNSECTRRPLSMK